MPAAKPLHEGASPEDETSDLSVSLHFYKLTERVPGVWAGQEQQHLAGKPQQSATRHAQQRILQGVLLHGPLPGHQHALLVELAEEPQGAVGQDHLLRRHLREGGEADGGHTGKILPFSPRSGRIPKPGCHLPPSIPPGRGRAGHSVVLPAPALHPSRASRAGWAPSSSSSSSRCSRPKPGHPNGDGVGP